MCDISRSRSLSADSRSTKEPSDKVLNLCLELESKLLLGSGQTLAWNSSRMVGSVGCGQQRRNKTLFNVASAPSLARYDKKRRPGQTSKGLCIFGKPPAVWTSKPDTPTLSVLVSLRNCDRCSYKTKSCPAINPYGRPFRQQPPEVAKHFTVTSRNGSLSESLMDRSSIHKNVALIA